MVDSNDAADLQKTVFRSLHEWEEHLKSYFLDIRLVGELPIANRELKELGRYIRNLVKRHGLTTATQTMAERYPRSFLVFLAHTAARNEERSFWDVVAREVGLSQSGSFFQTNHHWGRQFLKLAERFELETFADVGSSSEYVTSIRLHGGIPVYSLPDFFEEVLLPAVRKSQYANMDVPELIEQVLQRSAVQYFVDSPVRYFLQHGGETAQHFFERCLKMARAWEQQGDLPSAKELGLPRYVVRTFQEFMEGHLQTPKGKRLRPPRLYLEPYDSDSLFRLELPQEPVDAGQTGWRHEWRIAALTEQGEILLKSVSVRVRKGAGGFVTHEAEHRLKVPPSRLRVELQARSSDSNNQIMKRWFFDLAPPPSEPPVIAFRSEDGRLVRRDSALPGDVLWLLTPTHLEVQAPNRGRLLTEAHCLSGAWSGWKVEEWDLIGAQIVHLVNPESGQVCHSVPVQVGQTEPHLSGEKLQQVWNQKEAPFFVGKPPYLWLPRLTNQAPEEEMSRWSIHVRAQGDADPAPPSGETSLADLSKRGIFQVEDEGFLLPLATLLGDQAAGAYTVEVQGPRRFRSEFYFRVWPALTVEDLASYYLPGPQGPAPVVFHVQTLPIHRLEASKEALGVEVATTETPGRYRITVQPSVTVAELVLIQPGETEVQLPLELSVPRLRWTVYLDGETLDWTSEPPDLPVDKLLQSQHAYLSLDWKGARQAPEGRVLLQAMKGSAKPVPQEVEDSDGVVLQEVKLTVPRLSSRVDLDLVRFRDTLRDYADVSNFDLALAVEETEDTSALPLLQLHRELGVSCVLLEWTDGENVVLHWEAAHRLRNRRVRLWSAWRPWEPAHEFPIPDDVGSEYPQDAPGNGVFPLPVRLEPGPYWVAFRTAPEWERSKWEHLKVPPLPTKGSLLAECNQVDPQERLKAIESQRTAGKCSPFLAAFERACIFHLQENQSLRDREVQAAIEHLAAAHPRAIAVLYGWLQTLDYDLAAKLRVHMYRPERLKKLLKGNYPQHIIDAYMAGFIDTEIIEPESAQLVLTRTRNPEWQAHAIAVLVKRTDTNDFQAIVEQVQKGVFSDAVGLDLLAEHPEQALTSLYNMPASPVRNRLLRALALSVRSPKIVRPGIWIRSEAGWGKVREIWVNGKAQPYVLRDKQGQLVQSATLVVELPRQEETLVAEIDTANCTIRIQDVDHLFRCARSECPGFVALRRQEIVEMHCQAAHSGLSPAVRPSRSTWPYSNPLTFSWDVQHPYG